MGVISVDLQPETVLCLVCDTNVVGKVVRSSDIPGGKVDRTSRSFDAVSLSPDSTLDIGPFTETRRYIIKVDSGNVDRTFVKKRLNYNFNGTGIYSGGRVTINSGDVTKLDVEAGSGVIVDNYTDPGTPDVVRVTWPAFTAISVDALLTNFTSYIAIDRGGNITQFADAITAIDRRNTIVLCVVAHTNNVVVETVANFPPPAYDIPHLLIDFADSVGIVNRDGNQYSANGSNLKLNKSAGESFRIGSNWDNSTVVPNVTTDALLTAPTMFFSYRDGSGGWVPPPFSDSITPGKYDDGSGTLANVGNAKWTIQRIFYEPIGGDTIVAYGQTVYGSLKKAEAAIFGETFVKNPVLNDTSFRGYLLVRGNATNLTAANRAKFISVDKFGSGPSVGSSTSTTDLQGAYENSVSEGEIVTNTTQMALTVKDGQNDPTSLLYCGRDFSANIVFNVNAVGQIFGAWTGGTTANRPSSAKDYTFYFDTTIGKPVWFDGTNWVDATGTTV